jgi:hypothetical protein
MHAASRHPIFETSATDETPATFLDDRLSQGVEVSMNKNPAQMKCCSQWPIPFSSIERCTRLAGKLHLSARNRARSRETTIESVI